jgi:hypothetical protein
MRLSPFGTPAYNSLLYQPRMIDDDDKYGAVGRMKIGGGNRSTRKKLPWCHFVHHRAQMTRLGIEPDPLRWEAGD